MMKKLFISALLLLASPAMAQPYDYDAASTGNPGQMGAEISRLEEQIRQLRGENERLQHQIKQMEDTQRRFQEDMEFRMNGNTGAAGTMPPAPPPPPPSEISAPTVPSAPYPMPTANAPFPSVETPAQDDLTSVTIPPVSGYSPAPMATDPQTLRLPGNGGSTPRDLYNQGFRLLNQSDYAGAERAFAQFTTDFPNDPLIGNAWYWLGETFYVRRDYVQAANAFRQGYEALKEGPKAGDNLLKLAMSLAAMEKDKEACVVLKQVDSKYSSNSTALKSKVTQENTRLGCQ